MRGVDVVAVADPDPAARELAARTARADAHADAREAFARPDVDAAVVCAPNAAHAELAGAALDSGLHLYLEKPLATSSADGRRVVAAADAAGVAAAIGLSYRFDPLYARVRALLQEGVVGEVRDVSARWTEPLDPARMGGWKGTRADGGGVLLDLGVHQVDLLHWLAGQAIASVDEAELGSLAGEHDTVRVCATLSGDASFEAALGYGPERTCRWVFAGDQGWLAVDRGARTWTLARGSGPPRTHPRAGAPVLRRIRSLPVLRRERVFSRALHAWVGEVRGEPAPDLATPHDGLRALEGVESIETAAAAAAV